MNRRSFVRWLGLAPVAAPMVVASAAASASTLPPITYTSLNAALADRIDMLEAAEVVRVTADAKLAEGLSKIVEESNRTRFAMTGSRRIG